MSDNTAGGILASVMLIASEAEQKGETINPRDLAHQLFALSREYDFSWMDYDMEDELRPLGLAHDYTDPEWGPSVFIGRELPEDLHDED